MKRKIAAILAADIAGYSRLVAEDEEDTIRRLATNRGIFNDLVTRFGGRVFNTAGDAVLAEFQSAVDAVRCAVDVQESLRARNLAYPPSREMSFRIGISIGDVVERDGDLLGDGVNVAARLEAMAPAGGICISRSVYEAVSNKLSVKFSDKGLQHLKNIPDPVQVYAISLGHGVDQAPRPYAVDWATQPLVIVIMVLLVGFGGYLLFRHDETSAHLVPTTEKSNEADSDPSKSSEAKNEKEVSAAGSHGDPRNSTTEEGRASSEIKIAPAPSALIDDPVAQDATLRRQWRDCYGTNEPQLVISACTALIDSKVGSDAERAGLYLKLGRARREKADASRAVTAYSEAIRLAPSAEAYNDRGIAYYDQQQWDRAIEDYSEAIRIDPKNGEAFNNRAWTRIKKGDAASAFEDADQAVKLLPGKAYAWDTRAKVYATLGNREAAVHDYRKALALDPSNEASRNAIRRLTGAD